MILIVLFGMITIIPVFAISSLPELIKGSAHGYEITLEFSGDKLASGTLTFDNHVINLDDDVKVIERKSGFLIFDKENGLKILSKQVGQEKYLLLVKINSDDIQTKIRFITDGNNENKSQRNLLDEMNQKTNQQPDIENMSHKELQAYLKNQNTAETIQKQREITKNNANDYKAGQSIIDTYTQAQETTGLSLVVKEKIIKPKVVVVDNRVLHTLTDHYDKVSNNQEDVFRFAVKTFDKNVYSGVQWDKFEGKMDDVLVTAKIKDSSGTIKKEFSGLTKYGIFEGELKIDGELIYPVGNYSLELDVDFNGQKFNDVLYFIIYSDSTTFNNRAITNAGPDQHLASGSVATLDGSNSSDQDDNIIFYTWTQSSGTTAPLSNNKAENPTFTIPDEFGTFVFSLLVDDGRKDSDASDSVTITSLHSDAGPDQTPGAIGTVNLVGSGSGDALSHALTYAWTITSVPGGSLLSVGAGDITNPTAELASFETDVAGGAIYELQLVVDDGEGLTDTDTVTITVG